MRILDMRIADRVARLSLLFAVSFTIPFLSASRAAAEDTVSGSFTARGTTYKLSHVYVRREPSNYDQARTVVVVLLTDNPIPKNVLDDRYRLSLTDLAREGKIHGVSVKIGADRKPADTGFTYAKEFGGAGMNRADQHTFEPKVLDDSHAEGKLAGQGAYGNDKWEYTATFKATVGTLK